MTITLFQFLYGAIGRNNRSDNNFGKRCFNSYMVRLEDEMETMYLGGIGSFNSYMVRLEDFQILIPEALL